jgi:hypothetical protein
VRAKLKVDSVLFNSLENQTYYVAALLEGKARQWADPWVQSNEGTATFVPEGLLDHLAKGFEDRQLKEKAIRKIQTITQGSRSFTAYLAEFEQCLLNAKAGGWSDEVKIAFLSGGISPTLRGQLLLAQEPTRYEDFCDLAQRLDNHARFPTGVRQGTVSRQQQNNEKSPATSARPSVSSSETANPITRREPRLNATDQAKADTRRARWVSEEELKARREAGACLRCGNKNHMIRECRLLPPIRPARVAAIGTTQSSEAMEEVMHTAGEAKDDLKA